jgi:hypothetical protein
MNLEGHGIIMALMACAEKADLVTKFRFTTAQGSTPGG